jgi:hypothetical protein
MAMQKSQAERTDYGRFASAFQTNKIAASRTGTRAAALF